MMDKTLLVQLLALSLYAFFAGFCFCDGFRLHNGIKVVWFCILLMISFWVLQVKGQYDLALILPAPTLLALLICYLQKRRSKEQKN